jgi:predicted negative regulator of RcsB-dependent stress response
LIDRIAKDEQAFEQRRKVAEATAPAEKIANPPEFRLPKIKAEAGKKNPEGPKAVEARTDEAWKAITDAMRGGSTSDQAIIATAEAAERTAVATEKIAAKPDAQEVGIK